MRILHVTGTFLPIKGGGPYYVHHLSTQLERAGHDCRVVTTDAGGDPETETVPTVRARSLSVADFPVAPAFPRSLYRTIKRFQPDVIHANYPLPLYPDLAALLARVRSIPLLLTSHGALEMRLDSAIGLFGAVYNRTLLRGTLCLADHVHVSNDAILQAFEFLDRHREKTSVVPIGVDTDWFDPAQIDGRPPYRTAEGASTILFVGSFRRYKGLDSLIDAFAEVVPHHESRLVLIGDGPRGPAVQARIEDHGIESAVELVGHVSDEALRRAYAHADVFVLPSPTIRESYGMVAIEAMAMGVPTVVTHGSGIGQLLTDSPAGIVVEPNSVQALATELRSLLADPASRASEGRRSRRLVTDRFAWSQVIDEYLELYETLIAV